MLDRLERAVWIFGTICTVLVFVLTTAQVMLRYGFNMSPYITEEGARTMFVWSVFAGSAIAVRMNDHIKIDLLNLLLPKAAQRVLDIILDFIVLVLFVIVAVTGIDATMFAHTQVSSGLMLPLSYFYFVVPLFFGISAIFLAGLLFQNLFGRKSGAQK